jgi:hypothetical protein
MIKKVSLFIILASLMIGCAEKKQDKNVMPKRKNVLYGTWMISDASSTANIITEDKLLNEAKDNKIVQKGIMLSIFPDGTFTEFKGIGAYRYGKWRFGVSNKSILLSDSMNKVDTFFIKHEKTETDNVTKLLKKLDAVELSFLQVTEVLNDYKEDPFYHANNLWRVKPLAKESPEKIHERLGNYFKHLAYILKAASERKQQAVSFEYSQGIVKIYDGGIGINPLNIVPESWAKTFYKDEDAFIAYKMFEAYLINGNNYKGTVTGDWYKDDYKILASIYGDVKEGKFPKSIKR